MIELTTQLESVRNRFFRRRCPLRKIEQTLYHGSPLSGLVEMLRCGEMIPQGHAELDGGEWLSTSINDNVLRFFSDGENLTGLISTPSLSLYHLDEAHMIFAQTEVWSTLEEHVAGMKKIDTECVLRWGWRLGYEHIRLDSPTLRRTIGPEADGLIFSDVKFCPWMGLHHAEWNAEAEVALNDEGCEKYWKAVSGLYVRGKEFDDPVDGWYEVIRAGVSEGLVARDEVRGLRKRVRSMWGEGRHQNG